MAISIRNPKVERLARNLARQKGSTMTEAIIDALETSATAQDGGYILRRETLATIAAECAALPDMDKRETEDILGYGASGEFADDHR